MVFAVSRRDLCLLLASAVLTTLAYPPFHLFLPSFVCLVPAVLLLEKSNSNPLPLRSLLVMGFWFGILSNGLLLYWMVFALWRYTPLSVLGYAGTVLLLSVYSSALFAVSGWVVRATRISILVVFPVLWTAQEWILAHQGDLRFPWLGLGTSLTGFPTIIQTADIVGARGITFLLALANTALALAWMRRFQLRQSVILVGAVGTGIFAALAYGVVRERSLDIRSVGEVTLLQPNVSYREKRDPALWEVIVSSLLESSEIAQSESNPDLIVWPEAVVPGYLNRHRDWQVRISSLARQTSTPIVVGGLHHVSLSDSTIVGYNSAFIIDSAGRTDEYPVYHKQYLVPITERVPFLPQGLVDSRWFGSFATGEGGAVYELGLGGFGVLICYESAFENLSRGYRLKGADFLVNITNDAWFGRSSTPYQHASHLVMRAIENRIGIARAANTGVSEFVDPLGREHKRTALEVETHISGIVKTSDVLTVYTRLGDWVGSAVVLMALTLVGYAWWREKKPV
ncbi:apolipoprotein N-acyltransferase [Gemmatimonadota bacterium]